MILTGRICVIALAAVFLGPSLATAQQCLHGPDETPEQKPRKQAALAAARGVHNLQVHRRAAGDRKILDVAEMAARYAEDPTITRSPDPLNFDPASDVIPGWRLTFDTTEKGYWFMIKDTTDPCGFAYVTNEKGLIYNAQPIR